MIDRIVIENFKSLRKIDLSLGRMNLFIGTNASGKSNFLDALRVLQGIGNGFTISEILDGKPRSATNEVWDGIRGGSSLTCFAGTDAADEVTLEVSGIASSRWEYTISFSPALGRVTLERLKFAGKNIYDSTPISSNVAGYPLLSVCYLGTQGKPLEFKFDSARPVLGQFSNTIHVSSTMYDDANIAAEIGALMANTQRVDPSPPVLQRYSQAHYAQRLGDHGENFAALVRTICQDEQKKGAYLAWLQELRPDEVQDVGTLKGAVGEPLFMLKEGNQTFPAPVLSDGTLRFAAITAAFFQPAMPNIMTIEEIENGIHPGRLRLLVELLRSQTVSSATQVFATTHSPTTLAWLQESEYRTTFVCRRDEETGESTITPLTEVPHFVEVVKKHSPADLFAEGWLEAAL